MLLLLISPMLLGSHKESKRKFREPTRKISVFSRKSESNLAPPGFDKLTTSSTRQDNKVRYSPDRRLTASSINGGTKLSMKNGTIGRSTSARLKFDKKSELVGASDDSSDVEDLNKLIRALREVNRSGDIVSKVIPSNDKKYHVMVIKTHNSFEVILLSKYELIQSIYQDNNIQDVRFNRNQNGVIVSFSNNKKERKVDIIDPRTMSVINAQCAKALSEVRRAYISHNLAHAGNELIITRNRGLENHAEKSILLWNKKGELVQEVFTGKNVKFNYIKFDDSEEQIIVSLEKNKKSKVKKFDITFKIKKAIRDYEQAHNVKIDEWIVSGDRKKMVTHNERHGQVRIWEQDYRGFWIVNNKNPVLHKGQYIDGIESIALSQDSEKFIVRYRDLSNKRKILPIEWGYWDKQAKEITDTPFF